MAGVARSLEFTPDDFARWAGEIVPQWTSLDLRPAWADVALYLASQAKEAFDQGVAPDGTAWAPLASPSAKRGGATAKPLRDTGLLMASMQAGLGHVDLRSNREITWGTAVEYASFHQDGTRRIPARPFVGINDEMAGIIEQIVADHVVQMLGG